MLDQRRTAAQSEQSREQLFTQRYEILLEWALQLTNQHASAEDLVQDAFVQFMLARTQAEEIENIDGYLRRLLRNMHISRRNRLSQRLHDATLSLSIADYDSLRIIWRAIEPQLRLQVREELHHICTYACFRKESSRAGSVLILRFFLDYLPTEIASVLSSSRHCVDQWQRLARREVKLFMEEPGRLGFVNGGAAQTGAWLKYPGSDCDLMLAFRAMIFSSRQGNCLSKEQLESAYASRRADSLSTTDLAHIVSCRSCLDAVNTMLGLPLLAQRYPAEDCHRDEPPREGGSSGGSGGVRTLPKRFKRQLREIREHKPSELRISVNGVLRSSLKVNGESSEIDLNLPPEEQPEFIEVTSEQGIQLLFLSINDKPLDYEQWAEIELSEGRTLAISLRTLGGPTLHVVYNEPVVEETSLEQTITEKKLSSVLTIVPQHRTAKPKELKSRFLAVVRHIFRRDRNVAENPRSAAAPTSLGLSGQSRAIAERRTWSSPALFTFLFVIVAAAAFVLYKASSDKTPAATDLLAQATVAELDHSRLADRVGHRSINLEVRRSTEGALLSRRTIESWENYEQRQRIQRLYDESGRLLAAATQNDGGVRTVYHHQSKAPQPRGSKADSLLLDLEDVWQLTPSVQDFNTIIADAAAAVVQQRATSYVVTIEKERAIGASRLIKATLTLSKSDLHAIEQTLVVQRGSELREYKFVETTFELLPTRTVAPNIFQIDPELAGEGRTSNSAANAAAPNNNAGPSPSASNSAVASTELEIDVAYLLNQAKADRNEQVALTRSASGSLRVEGVLESNERREEFLRVLRPVANNPAVVIQLRTIAEASTQPLAQGKQSVREIEDTANTIAVDQDLRDYFSKRGLSGEALDESVRAYSSRVVNHSYQALFHAIELRRLALRFAHVDMRTVAPEARTKWLEMVRERALAFSRETVALRRELQPIFTSDTSSSAVEDFTISNDADLTRAIERLHRMALANNQAISQAFTISADSSASAFKSPQFKRTLEGAVSLSNRVSQLR